MTNTVNKNQNPACGISTNKGWSNGTRVTSLTGFPRSTGYQVTTAKSTISYGIIAREIITLSFWFKPSANGQLTYGSDTYISVINSSGYVGSSSSFITTTLTAGQTYFITLTCPDQVGGFGFGTIYLLPWVSGCAGTVSCVTMVTGSTAHDFFDGETDHATWSGTRYESSSTLVSDFAQTISPTGIPTGGAFGPTTVAVDPGPFIFPAGIVSGGTFGSHTLTTGPVSVSPSGVPSSEAFGNATMIHGYLMVPQGIPSGEAFGALTVSVGPVGISVPSIASAQAFGTPSLVRKSVAVVSQVRQKLDDSIRYDITVVHRIMQQQSVPMYVEVDPLDWSGLSYTETLSAPTTLTAGVPVANITTPVVQILKDMSHKACEIWVRRNGRIVFAGPWLTWQIQNNTLTLTAKGPLAYLDWMYVMSDTVFASVDQFTIGKTLVNAWQALDYGNFGIDTSGIGLSSITRDATYLKNEGNQLSKRLSELGARQNGFDFGIDPTTRQLNFYYPIRGVDRSTGIDAIIFDDRNVVNNNVLCSAGPQDIASEGIVVGTGSGSTDGNVYATKSNLDLRAQFGRTGFFKQQDGVVEQSTADAYAQAFIDARTDALLVPGPDVRVTLDADLASYDVGDTVAYTLHNELEISGAYRIKSRRITVSKDGKETMTPTFV